MLGEVEEFSVLPLIYYYHHILTADLVSPLPTIYSPLAPFFPNVTFLSSFLFSFNENRGQFAIVFTQHIYSTVWTI